MWAVCFQVFVVTLGVGVVTPVVGVDVRDAGGSLLGVGIAYAAFYAARLLLTPVFGRLSDLRGRRPYILAGLVLTAVSGLVLLSAGAAPPGASVAMLVVGRLLQGTGSALTVPVLTACAGTISPPSSVGSRMGLFNGMRYGGFAIGVFTGVALLKLQAPAALIAYTSVVATGLVALAVQSALPERATRAARSPTRYLEFLRNPVILWLSAYRAALATAMPALVAFLPVLLKSGVGGGDGGVGGDGSQAMAMIAAARSLPFGKGLILAATGLATGGLQIVLGRLLDRRSRRARAVAAVLGAVVIGAVLMALPRMTTFRSFAWASALAGLGVGALFLPGTMLMVDSARAKGMGSVVAVMELAAALGQVVGALAAGAAALVSPVYLFPAVAGFPVLASVFHSLALRASATGTRSGGGYQPGAIEGAGRQA